MIYTTLLVYSKTNKIQFAADTAVILLKTSLIFLVSALADPCLSRECDFGGKCILHPNGTTECVCRDDCPPVYSPVCASDENTYPNNCSMIAESCRIEMEINFVRDGVCEGMNKNAALLVIQSFCYTCHWKQQLFYPPRSIKCKLSDSLSEF